MTSGNEDMSLFNKSRNGPRDWEPLAYRMTPQTLDDFVGQDHILSQGKLLRRAIDADKLFSAVFYGPPGCGKSALARIIANKTSSFFEEINAVTAGIQDIRNIRNSAIERLNMYHKKTILQIDELHHFNRTQQDALLPDVEKGHMTLIGTTTENPFFYINKALLSRSQVFEFKPLKDNDLDKILKRTLSDNEKGLGKVKIGFGREACELLINLCSGDARRLLNALEIAAKTTAESDGIIKITPKVIEESIQKKTVNYDKGSDEHYDTISAFIKSMRGTDPDSTLYWLAKMLYAGEDPRFIARRIIICASEDVGNADPIALILAHSALGAVDFIGMPEARIPLAQAAVYVACAPKSNSSYAGIEKALDHIKNAKVQDIPNHLKDPTMDRTSFGHGKGYMYPHDFKGHWVDQKYMRDKIQFYFPTDQGREALISKRLDGLHDRQGRTEEENNKNEKHAGQRSCRRQKR